MKLYVVSICHMTPEIIRFSLTKGIQSIGRSYEKWVLLDNRWPMGAVPVSELAVIVNGFTLVAPKNLGGHGGVNHVVKFLNPDPDDLVILYDPDSNPNTKGWGKAMVEVMQADRNLDAVSLMINPTIINNRNWRMREVSGYLLASDFLPEMYNVTCFRASVLKAGLLGIAQFYGGIEAVMHAKGMRHEYLYDYQEEPCPIPHPKIYSDWKVEHAQGRYPGNFDQYVIQFKDHATDQS